MRRCCLPGQSQYITNLLVYPLAPTKAAGMCEEHSAGTSSTELKLSPDEARRIACQAIVTSTLMLGRAVLPVLGT